MWSFAESFPPNLWMDLAPYFYMLSGLKLPICRLELVVREDFEEVAADASRLKQRLR